MSPLTIATFCLGLLAAATAPQEPSSPEAPKTRAVKGWVSSEGPRVFTWNGEEVESQEPQATCPHCQKKLPAPKPAQRLLLERSKGGDQPEARIFSFGGDGKLRAIEGAKGLEGLKQFARAKELKQEVKELKGLVLADPERFRGRVMEALPRAQQPRIERRMDEQGNVEVIEITPGQQRIRLRAQAQDEAAPAPKAKVKEKVKDGQRAKGKVRVAPKTAPQAADPHGVRVHRLPAHTGGTTIIILGGQGEPQVHVGGHAGPAAPRRIEISQLAVPSIELEGLEIPAIEVEGFEMPALEIGDFEIDEFEIPAFEVEGFEIPALELGAFELPHIRFEGFRFPGAPCGPAGGGSCDASAAEERREVAPKAAAAPASTRDLIHL